MPDHEVYFDVSVPLAVAGGPGHNRWHPEVVPLISVAPGETVALDLRDGFDLQVTMMNDPGELLRFDRTLTHPMTGPIFVEGAEPGDLLLVEVLAIEPGTEGVSCINPGLGFLSDLFPRPFLVKWRLEGGFARSENLPGIAIPGTPFLGLVGVAPSHQRLKSITKREVDLSQRGAAVRLPDPHGATPAVGRHATHGLRTTPPREIGGNLDVKNLTEGSRITLPVDVRGALCSVGDVHFAQGDGEVCGNAIEMSGRVTLRFGILKSSEVDWRPSNPVIEFEEPRRTTTRRFISTIGFPIADDGRNEHLDTTLAARAALIEMIGYLTTVRGLSEDQAYVLASVAVDLKISEIVDSPNAIVSAALPLDIFQA